MPNTEKSTTNIRRVEMAMSGDLAYEFSEGTLSYELKTGEEVLLTRSTLRVWRKEGGQWKVATVFMHPHEDEPNAR